MLWAALGAVAWLATLDLAPLVGELTPLGFVWLWLASAGLTLMLAAPVGLLAGVLGRLRPGTAPAGRVRLLVGLGGVIIGTGLHLIDRTAYVHLYLILHLALLLAAVSATAVGVRSLLGPRARSSARTAMLAVACWAALTVVATTRVLGDRLLRYQAIERTTGLGHTILALQAYVGVLGAPSAPTGGSELSPTLAASATSVRSWHGNVLLITVDAMRADSVPPDGVMAQLAAEGTVFERAYAPSCWTIHSMSSVLTSRVPGQLHFTAVSVDPKYRMTPHDDTESLVTNPANFKKTTPCPWSESQATLQGVLASHGWQTATPIAYVFYRREAGVTRDFEVIDEAPWREHNLDNEGVTSEALTDGALRFLAARDPARPFFLWIHYMDPHAPYLARDASSTGGDARARYASELRAVDHELARLRAELQHAGQWDDTLVVVHADHGEEFREHGGQFHATTLYDEEVHVPLIVRLPAQLRGAAPARVDTPVSLLDLMPTLLDLTGTGAEVLAVGRSLAGVLLDHQPAQERPIYLDCTRFGRQRRGVVLGTIKVIVDRVTGTIEIYDLAHDPGEHTNLVDQAHPEWAPLVCAALGMP